MYVEELEDLPEWRKARRQLWREQSRKREEEIKNKLEGLKKKDTAQPKLMSKEREEAQPEPTVEMETTNSQEKHQLNPRRLRILPGKMAPGSL